MLQGIFNCALERKKKMLFFFLAMLQSVEMIREKQTNVDNCPCSHMTGPQTPHLTMLSCSFSCTTWCYNEYKHECGLLCCTETWNAFPLTLTCWKPSTSSETCRCCSLLLQRKGRGKCMKHGDLWMAYTYPTWNRNHNPFNYSEISAASPSHAFNNHNHILFSGFSPPTLSILTLFLMYTGTKVHSHTPLNVSVGERGGTLNSIFLPLPLPFPIL